MGSVDVIGATIHLVVSMQMVAVVVDAGLSSPSVLPARLSRGKVHLSSPLLRDDIYV
jgi:hypothetical protein